MNYQNAEFIISAVSKKQFLNDLPEIVFCGKSNVGKSSILNCLLGRKALARTSSKPGKTAQINYFKIDDTCYFVDLPGYGFAAVSKSEKNLWGKVITDYLNVRPQLYLVLMLVDIRHKPSKDDENMYQWILKSGIDYLIVATKSDKLSKQQAKNNAQIIRNTLQIPPEKDIICVSAEKRTGIDKLWEAIDSYIVEDEDENKEIEEKGAEDNE